MSETFSGVSIKDSIATRLLTSVFSIYFLVALSVTVVHMVAEYYNTRDYIVNDLVLFQKTFEQGLAAEVWNLDEDSLRLIVQGIINIPSIVGVLSKLMETTFVGYCCTGYLMI